MPVSSPNKQRCRTCRWRQGGRFSCSYVPVQAAYKTLTGGPFSEPSFLQYRSEPSREVSADESPSKEYKGASLYVRSEHCEGVVRLYIHFFFFKAERPCKNTHCYV